ncbi:MAG TPA: ankyrin repeat domain-containing protein [Steroidobacter sp.]|uniref:ankyrin repeat domain-containing protein n=1 Tax=Steroidobacter sp. TaxID=1978227 RepID=UPI002EDAF015
MRAQIVAGDGHYAVQPGRDSHLNERQSNTTAMAGQLAVGLTIVSCLWIGVLWLVREPFARAPVFFASVFWLVGLMLVVCAVLQWRERLRAGGATLRLTQDPLPLGIPLNIAVEFAREPAAGDWRAKVYVRRQLLREEDPRMAWRTELAISQPVGNRATFTLQLPADVPDTVGGSREKSVGCELHIHGPRGAWAFRLATRPATERELAEHALPHATNVADPGPSDAQRRRGRALLFGATVLGGLLPLGMFLSATGFDTGIAIGPSYAVPAEMPPFAFRISNWRDNRWGVQAHLEGTARVTGRTLEVSDARLQLRGFLRCAKQTQCQIESASLLLARDGDTHFTTLTESESTPLNLQLRGYEIAEAQSLNFRLELPEKIARDGVYIKLALRTAGNAEIYIDSQKLTLQRKLAAHERAVDPCTKVKRMDDAVRSGCPAANAPSLVGSRLAGIGNALSSFGRTLGIVRSPAPLSLDATLILALRLEANDWIPALIAAGANPNARDPSNPQLTALALAAEFDDVELMDLLLERGANPSLETTNELGQTVTPLNRALRRDSARAVAKLLAAGAPPIPPDATGWSTIHVAAYEGASMSLRALVHAGADVNQRSIPRAQNQTPLMTAIQHANGATIRQLIELGADPRLQDSNGHDSCDWAKRFEKDSEVIALVCAETNNARHE